MNSHFQRATRSLLSYSAESMKTRHRIGKDKLRLAFNLIRLNRLQRANCGTCTVTGSSRRDWLSGSGIVILFSSNVPTFRLPFADVEANVGNAVVLAASALTINLPTLPTLERPAPPRARACARAYTLGLAQR